MRRFYRINILPDLFGSVLLMKQWERIGSMSGAAIMRRCSCVRVTRRDGAMRHRQSRGLGPSANPD
nr:hypothetical protein [Methylocystis echinoides]